MMDGLLSAIKTSSSLLASKFVHMLHMLCDSMGPRAAYTQICFTLSSKQGQPSDMDAAFATRMIYRMGVALLVSPRLLPLVAELTRLPMPDTPRGSDAEAGLEKWGGTLLDRLMRAFFHNAPAAISLALIAQVQCADPPK